MSHDAAHAAALVIAGAAAILAAAPPQAPLGDGQVLAIAVACGAIGGVVATLMAEDAISVRGMLMRGLASILIAPGIVTGGIIYTDREPTLMIVASAAGVAGMLAWPVAQQSQKVAQMAVKHWITRAKQ
jgi:hypothetical protein